MKTLSDEERHQQLLEELLIKLLWSEIDEENFKWSMIQDQETQVKLDLADMILADLTTELVFDIE